MRGKKIVRFMLPVEFRYDTEAGFRYALREFKNDPVYSCDGINEHGYYGWTQGRQRKLSQKRVKP